jgi:hypothetical protein
VINCLFAIAHLISRSDRYIADVLGLQLIAVDPDRVAIGQGNGHVIGPVLDANPLHESPDRFALRRRIRADRMAVARIAVMSGRDPDMLRTVRAGDTEDAFSGECAAREPAGHVYRSMIVHE